MTLILAMWDRTIYMVKLKQPAPLGQCVGRRESNRIAVQLFGELSMPNRVAYFNGEFIPEREARVSIFDSALIYGDMVFEVTRTFGQQPFCLKDHLDRLEASLRLVEIDCGLSMSEIAELTHQLLNRNLSTESADMDWVIMHNVSRGPDVRFTDAFLEMRPSVNISCYPIIASMGRFAPTYDTGISVVIPSQQAVPAQLVDPKAKTRSRLHYKMAGLQGQRMGSNWPVMLDPDGFLAEGPGWNIMLVKDGELLSPEARNILNGVSRKTTMQLATELGIKVRECNLDRYDALQADEIIVTSTSFCLIHVATFEGQQVSGGQPGPVFLKLQDAWKERVGVDFVEQARSFAAQLETWQTRERESLS